MFLFNILTVLYFSVNHSREVEPPGEEDSRVTNHLRLSWFAVKESHLQRGIAHPFLQSWKGMTDGRNMPYTVIRGNQPMNTWTIYSPARETRGRPWLDETASNSASILGTREAGASSEGATTTLLVDRAQGTVLSRLRSPNNFKIWCDFSELCSFNLNTSVAVRTALDFWFLVPAASAKTSSRWKAAAICVRQF